MSLMEIDRTCLEHAEEAWITKYRSAVKTPSIEQSRLMKIREAVNNGYNVVVLRAHRILDRWKQARMQRPTPSLQPVLVTEPQTLTQKMNQAGMNQPGMNQATMKQVESSVEQRPEKAPARSKTA
ncbi:MAG TPA: hypothetical protein VK706_02980 [Candidatus Sulfotelmatobacter sp.]|jgi:hypothetical protein|nr:hypothetical protein [Candidatus Sulfotelmatobacter sp.]